MKKRETGKNEYYVNVGSVTAMLVKYLSAWDKFWGLGFESSSGKML